MIPVNMEKIAPGGTGSSPPCLTPRPRGVYLVRPIFGVYVPLFPDAVEPYLGASILGLARKKGLVEYLCVDFRDFARDRHRTVDDRPFGGGPGMVLRPEPIAACVEWLEHEHGPFRKLALCPAGTPFRQSLAEELSTTERVLLLCGRYEGYDQRLLDELGFETVSLGDYVLSGGELGAMAITEAAVRLIPGVLGDDRSATEDSFHGGGGLDHPHYTRPRVWREREVPEVLFSGNHESIREWRAERARERTNERRPDLTDNDN